MTFSSVLIGLIWTLNFFAWAQVDYISPGQVSELEELFAEADSPIQVSELFNKGLVCTMYGVRTRMSKEEQVPLYRFSYQPSEELHNQGSQPIARYSLDASGRGLRGQLRTASGVIQDHIRLHSSGRWISQLTVVAESESSQQDKSILAYSVCSQATI